MKDLNASMIELQDEIQAENTLAKAKSSLSSTPIEVNEMAQLKWVNFGEQLLAVRNVAINKTVDERLINTADGVNTTIDEDGGYLVDKEFINSLLDKFYNNSTIYNDSRKVPIGGGKNGLKLNFAKPGYGDKGQDKGVTVYGGVQAYWIPEAGNISVSTPKFDRLDLTLGKVAVLTYTTAESLQDTTSLSSFMSEAAGEGLAFMVDNAIIRGDGSENSPTGILSHKATGKIDQVAGDITFDTLTKMYAKLPPTDRKQAKWYICQDLIPNLLTIQDKAGRYIYIPAGVVAGQPYSTLLGRPVVETDATSAAGTNGDIIFANFGRYVTINKGGIQAATSIHVKFESDQQAFRFVLRMSGAPQYSEEIQGANGKGKYSPFAIINYTSAETK